ncbi:MAG: 16S rRNA (guanine(966)-N(2))-methyltransferase RsmD [Bacteroidota bacterium]|nr:16S rRNA (guanine(966)-N(2))-methyltransferase RsmD [Bacteroidota bacterium]MDP4234263.1 16S rRNA (guanine(966)-N(2))-methyltransferase RsmD [Bacteroidota bacterium]MDP4243453.1 16S rRNA (guanine(966)-N(2))-methyltransferase RsmD [Bacteroidota bacterium]MDP4289155.1 16S rRNA (guanine(966)-N(2))-methyltransferase RsmD [Bacteroidota bacterium]
MRIVAGKFRSRELLAPSNTGTRPTTDRAREALFNVLANMIEFDGVRVLDLFAGSGALAFEALSRGAQSATLVERDRKATEAIRKNAEKLEIGSAITLVQKDVFRFLEAGRTESEPYSLIFSDAPYDETRALQEIAHRIFAKDWLAPGGICVIEHRTGDQPHIPENAKLLRELRAGEASFTIIV